VFVVFVGYHKYKDILKGFYLKIVLYIAYLLTYLLHRAQSFLRI